MESMVDAQFAPADPGRSVDRMVRLQGIIASFSGSLTPEEVADTILIQATEALGADAGSVVALTADGGQLERVSTVGYPPHALEQFGRYSLTDSVPAAEAIRTGQAIWIPSPAAWRSRYPELAQVQAHLGFQAAACIPLRADGHTLGLLVLSFKHPREHTQEDRAFALTLAQQCAQALDRSRLYAAERGARAQAELERARLYDLFMRAPARIALSRGPDHIYVFANQQYVAELDDPNIIGRSAREVFPGAADQGIITVADRVYATGEPFIRREAPFRVDRDGDGAEEDRYFDVVLQPSYEPDGSVGGVMLFTMDVTEAVRSRQRVEQLLAERTAILVQKDDFLAAAAHDLKTPLTTIKGVVQLLQRRAGRWDAPEADELMNGLTRVDHTVSKMNALINTLLDITRLQMDQPLALEKRQTDLVALARTVIDDGAAISKRHTLRLESETPSIAGSFDAFRIERVFNNLLTNAIRYSPEGGEILVEIRQVSEEGMPWVVISVCDHGLGIPSQEAAHIFDRFYRASNVEGKIVGAGIGLAGVRQIVEQHGGSISAQSEPDGATTFTVRLPLLEEDSPPAVHGMHTVSPGAAPTER